MTTLAGTLYVKGVAVNGSLWLEVCQHAIGAGGANVTPSAPYVFSLTNGQISGPGGGPYTVPGNDTLTPAGTWYFLTVFGSSGEQLLRGNVSITGASADIGAWVQASTQVFVPPLGYSVALIGDANGLSTANTVTKIHGKTVAGPPWTPGDVMTVKPDGNLELAAPSGGGGGTPSGTVSSETAFGQSPSAGAASTYSRGDHTHGTPAAPTPASIGAAPASHSHAQSDVTNLVTDLAAKITQDGNARVGVKKAGSLIGTRRGINLIEGANVTLTVSDDAGNEEVDVTVAAAGGGGGTPGSSVVSETSYGQSTAVGTSTDYARADHSHGSPALPTPAAIGAAAASHGHAPADLTLAATDRLVGRATAGSGPGEEITCTAFGRSLLDDVDAAAGRSTLGAPPATHASQHQHGGSDEVGTITPAANAIPKAGADGKLSTGWLPEIVRTAEAGVAGDADAWVEAHFHNSGVGANGPFTGTALSSGTATSIPAGTATSGLRPGAVRMRSSTTANSGYRWVTTGNMRLNAPYLFRGWFWTPASFTNSQWQVGFTDATSGTEATDGAYLLVNGSGVASGKTASGGTRSTSSTTYTLATSTWYLMEVEIFGSGASATFRIYSEAEVLLWTDSLSSNMPTAAGRETAIGIVVTNTGTTATDLCVVDYMGFGTRNGYSRARLGISPGVYTPEQYGGIADGNYNTGGAMTAASATLTLSGAPGAFTPADVGKTIVVEGAGASNGLLITTIAGYTSGTVVTLAATAGTTCVGGWVYWGTNNSSAFTSLAAATPSGARISLRAGIYLSTTALSLGVQNVMVAGAGKGSTTLLIASTTANAIEWSATGTCQRVHDLTLQGMGGFMTAGAGVAYTGSAHPYFGGGLTNVRVLRFYRGVYLPNAGPTHYEVDNLTVHEAVSSGVTTNATCVLHGGQIFVGGASYSGRFSITASSTTLTAGSATFSAHQIGDRVIVLGAGAGGLALSATITAVASSTSCTISVSASTTVSGVDGQICSRMDSGWRQSNGNAYLSDLDIVGGDLGIYLIPGSGETVFEFVTNNVLCDSQFNCGLLVGQSGTGTLVGLRFSNSWFASAGAFAAISGANYQGARIAVADPATCKDVTFTGCKFVNCRAEGLFAQQVTGLSINGGSFENGTTGTTQQAWVYYGSNLIVDGVRFTKEHYYAGITTTYCLKVESTGGAISVQGNLFRAFSTSGYTGVAHNGTSVIVANNATLA